MTRNPVQVRDATPDDAVAVLEVFAGLRRRGVGDRCSDESRRAETATSLARIAADPDQRLLLGVVGGRVAGAAHLTRAPLSPVHLETAVHVSHLHVLRPCRRHGVGHALLEAAVSWAEEKDTQHVLVAAEASSRDANRFLARLGFGAFVTVRAATVPALRTRFPVLEPVAARVGSRNQRSVGQVLAHRRSLRRARAKAQ